MKVYGSLMNRIAENATQPTPEIGMGVTLCYYSDRHAGTVVEIISPKRIVIQEDKSTLVGGSTMSENQDWEHIQNPNGAKHVFTLRKNGRWVKAGEGLHDGLGISLGHRDRYYDPCF